MAIRIASSAALAALSLGFALLASGCGSGEKAAPPAAAPAPPTAAAPAPAPPTAAAPAPAAPSPTAAAPAEEEPASDAPPGGAYPADYPSDVPRYPDSKVSSTTGSAQEGIGVTIQSHDGADVVVKYFDDGFRASGWETTVQALPDGTMITAEKEGASAEALVTTTAAGAQIDLIVGRLPQ